MRRFTSGPLRVLVVPAMGLIASACMIVGVRGSGNVITEMRDVTGFSEIVVGGSGVVRVDVTGTESLSIEAEDNIMPLLETTVTNGRLVLDTTRSISPTVDVVYTITAATLEGLEVSGSAAVDASGIDATDFSVHISGSGDVVAAGTLDGLLSISISGSGEFDGESLTAPDGNVEISGSGSAVVDVTENLEVSVSGSGNVDYLGTPAVDIDTSGSGNVSQRD
jgi:hypothetical protein